ncbi:unnamed protein product [Penicillium pancosmium]
MGFTPSEVGAVYISFGTLVVALTGDRTGQVIKLNLNKYIGWHDGALKWDSSGYDEYCNISHFRWEGEVPTMQAEMLEFPDGHPLIPLRLDRITIEDGAFNVQSEKPDLSFPNDAMLKLIEGHILTARIKDQQGDRHESSLDLDNYLGNNNSNFEWDSKGFSKLATDASFKIEDGVPILRAKLRSNGWESYERKINLAERIKNSEGKLECVHYPRHFLREAGRVRMNGSVLQVEIFSDDQGPHYRTAELDLDKCLAKDSWGHLKWNKKGGSGFRNINFRLDGEGKVPTLHGQLGEEYVSISAERIASSDGKLYIKYWDQLY